MKPIVNLATFGQEEKPAVTSMNVAEVFGKRHDLVLRAIRNLECSDEFRLHNFAEASYTDAQGKERPMYVMTRDGFTFLAMGFTGKKAAQFKEAYIRQFNRMERQLQQQEAKRLAARREGIAARRTMTDEIKDSGEQERLHGYAYARYTMLAHGTALGETQAQTRERLHLTRKDNIRDHLDASELKQLESTEKAISGLLAYGMDYGQIKEVLNRKTVKRIGK